MPWVKEVLLRLQKALKDQELVKVMTFISSIGLIQKRGLYQF